MSSNFLWALSKVDAVSSSIIIPYRAWYSRTSGKEKSCERVFTNLSLVILSKVCTTPLRRNSTNTFLWFTYNLNFPGDDQSDMRCPRHCELWTLNRRAIEKLLFVKLIAGISRITRSSVKVQRFYPAVSLVWSSTFQAKSIWNNVSHIFTKLEIHHHISIAAHKHI